LDNIKVKPLTKDQLVISIDRLTRFKRGKYYRVFSEIILNNLISPKFKKSELEQMNPKDLKLWAEKIINFSLEKLELESNKNYSINKKLFDYENSTYILDKNTLELIDNKINYQGFIKLIDGNCVKNLQWLKALGQNDDIKLIREKYSLKFPIEKIVIAEGATEEILLPEFSKLCGYDFDKNGIHIIPAGGKNQVVKLYYELIEYLKLPIFILLDKDAKENLEQIKPKLRKIDKIHLLECGEFEDLLPLNLINRTLEYELSTLSILDKNIFNTQEPRTKILEEIFKTRGMHEFKKAEFAKMIKTNIKDFSDISPEIEEIIKEIQNQNKIVDN
jgi:hypothetical protein